MGGLLKYFKEPITWIIIVMFLIITYIVSVNVDEVLGHLGFDSKSKLRAEVATLEQDNNLLRSQLDNVRRQAILDLGACHAREGIITEFIDSNQRVDGFIKGVIKDTSNILLNPDTVKIKDHPEETVVPSESYDRVLLAFNTLWG